MKELFLDTTIPKQAQVGIKNNGEQLVSVTKTETLPAIVAALEKAKLKLEDIDSFSANLGPGSYTGLRIGLTVINTLNWALAKKTKLLEPKYQ